MLRMIQIKDSIRKSEMWVLFPNFFGELIGYRKFKTIY